MDFRALRKLLRLTQSEAAALFGVGRTTWHNWEAGREVPGPALRLARLLMTRPELATELT
jgi:DNA-binding transcriptional regulator YiaG